MMRKYSKFQKTLAILLLTAIAFEFQGCYSIRAVSKGEIQYSISKIYYIHGTKSYYSIINPTISEGILTGNLYTGSADIKKSQSVHIYIAPDSAIKRSGDIISFPFDNIGKVEVFKIDGGKTLLTTAGTVYGSFFVYALILLITKGVSCPFIYSDNGITMNFEGEIFSGATSLPLERNDYLKLKSLRPVGNSFRIALVNEIQEIQNTNLAELMVFDHPAGTELLMDKHGIPYTASDVRKPLKATDSYGRSLMKELSYCDTLRYISDIKNDPVLMDTVTLTFERPVGARDSKLIISGRNTMWLDYIFGKYSDLFGKWHDQWKKQRNRRTAEELTEWMKSQGILLSVYLETGSGLRFVDYFNVPGPMADRDDIMKIDLSEAEGDIVKIKLVSGMLFWDIDFAGMDFSSEAKITEITIPPSTAVDENDRDVTELILFDDNRYLVQPDGNNRTLITFPAVAEPGMNRSYFLHTKGNYDILRDAKGRPDLAYLRNFREPGYLIKFSKDHLFKYYLKSN